MSNQPEVRTTWQTSRLADVIEYFTEGFTLVDGGSLIGIRWWVDQVKGEVVFCLTAKYPNTSGSDTNDGE